MNHKCINRDGDDKKTDILDSITIQIDGILDYVKGTPVLKRQPTSLHETIISAHNIDYSNKCYQ
ncbi:MAG: hypothetical protein ACKO7Y_04340 [Candidatus Nitrosotenuis sp.]